MKLLKDMLLEELSDANGTIEEDEILEIDEYLETEEYRLMQEIDFGETINDLKNLYN